MVGWEGWATVQRWLHGRDGQWHGGGCPGRMGNRLEVVEVGEMGNGMEVVEWEGWAMEWSGLPGGMGNGMEVVEREGWRWLS